MGDNCRRQLYERESSHPRGKLEIFSSKNAFHSLVSFLFSFFIFRERLFSCRATFLFFFMAIKKHIGDLLLGWAKIDSYLFQNDFQTDTKKLLLGALARLPEGFYLPDFTNQEVKEYINNFVFYEDFLKDLHKKSLLDILNELKTFAIKLFPHLSPNQRIDKLSTVIVPRNYRWNLGSQSHNEACIEIANEVKNRNISDRRSFHLVLNQLNDFIEQIQSLPINKVLHLEKTIFSF